MFSGLVWPLAGADQFVKFVISIVQHVWTTLVRRNVSSRDTEWMNKWRNIRPIGEMNETTGDKLKDAMCCVTATALQKKPWPNTFFYTSSHLRMKLPPAWWWWCTNIPTTCYWLLIPDESNLINWKVKESIRSTNRSFSSFRSSMYLLCRNAYSSSPYHFRTSKLGNDWQDS